MTKRNNIRRKPILDALRDGIDFDKILYNVKSIGPEMDAIIRTAKSQGVVPFQYPVSKLNDCFGPSTVSKISIIKEFSVLRVLCSFLEAQDLLDKCYDEDAYNSS